MDVVLVIGGPNRNTVSPVLPLKAVVQPFSINQKPNVTIMSFDADTNDDSEPTQQFEKFSCLTCVSGKRCCDRKFPECGRCARLGKECVYRPEKKKKKKKSASTALVHRKPTTKCNTIPSASELQKIEQLLDSSFLTSCLETFHNNMGLVFSFGEVLSASDFSSLYGSSAMSVLTDSVLSCTLRGIGWITQAQMHLERAKSMVSNIYSETSDVSFAAMIMLGLSCSGGDINYTKRLMGLSARKRHPDFQIDLNKPFSFYSAVCFDFLQLPALRSPQAQSAIDRVHVRAKNVRRLLELRLSREDLLRYGPWDNCDHRNGYFAEVAEMTEIEMRTVLRQMETEAAGLRNWIGTGTLDPRLGKVLVERHNIISGAIRCSLHYALGEFDAARQHAVKTISGFSTLTAGVWFFSSISELIHIVDVSIGLRDLNLFEKAMKIVQMMAPLFPIMERVSFALSGAWSFFQNEFDLDLCEVLTEAWSSSSDMQSPSDLEKILDLSLESSAFDGWL